MLAAAVVHEMRRFGWLRFCELRQFERAFDLERASLAAGLLCFKHNFKHVQRVVRRHERARAVVNALDEVPQAEGQRLWTCSDTDWCREQQLAQQEEGSTADAR